MHHQRLPLSTTDPRAPRWRAPAYGWKRVVAVCVVTVGMVTVWFGAAGGGAVYGARPFAPAPLVASMPEANAGSLLESARQFREAHSPAATTIRISIDGESAAAPLTLRPFRIASSDLRFVRGQAGQADSPAEFDPSTVMMLRGATADGGHVVLAVTTDRVVGVMERGSGEWLIAQGDPGAARVHFRSARGSEGGPPQGVEICELAAASSAPAATPRTLTDGLVRSGRHVLELAVDTDYEFYTQFPDAASASLYLMALYGAMADIYERDLNVGLVLTYVRLWETPTDPYDAPNPMTALRTHWQTQMAHVQRDGVQLLSGRRNLTFTGTATLAGLCGTSAYCAVGYINGWTTDGGLARWDVVLAAHELAHLLGAEHTHTYGVDACAPANPGIEQRGTIMSYCNVHNGGIDNMDLRFHNHVQQVVASRLAGITCLMPDCNFNGVADEQDISAGTSLDVNGNFSPDECEDCDGDGVRNDVEIAKGAADADGDGVPDACASDCNANTIPDRWETYRRLVPDVDGDGQPDVCQPDCDGDGAADITRVHLQLDLDVNRNAQLDVCDDCDLDGVPDLVALDSAHRVWVANSTTSGLRSYHPGTGARMGLSQGAPLVEAHDLWVSPAGVLLVTLPEEDRIAAYDGRTGAVLPDFSPPGAAGLDGPAFLAAQPDGSILVTCRDGHDVRELEADTGALRRVLVPAGSGGLDQPYGLAVSPNGLLYVASAGTGEILAYDADGGAFRGVFVGSNGEQLAHPRGMTLRPNGNLLVASLGTGVVAEFDGQTGAWLGDFNGPTSAQGNFIDPWSVHIGPNGHVFVSVFDRTGAIVEYDGRTGMLVRGFVDGPHSGLNFTTGFGFLPGDDTDCNFNQTPDACDLASGRSADDDHDGIPDECAGDCDGNGVRDIREILPAGWRYDCNFNGILDDCELAGGLATDADGDSLVDACDHDGDNDRIDDSVDICPATPAGQRVRPDGAPYGDFDGDCRVTLADLPGFAGCLGGPGVPAASPPCAAVLDFDRDGDVDLRDFRDLQAAF